MAAAIRPLRAAGIDPCAIWMSSPKNRWSFRRGVLDRPSHMSLVSVLGAIVFGTLATAFIRWTQHNYRLVTGGMPSSRSGRRA